jgi:arsenate reductase (glutaredoxin)
MKHLKIYHNPRCSKSRKTLQIIRDHGVEPEVIEYLKKPPTESELKKISNLLGLDPKHFVRINENDFKENGLSEKISDNAAMFQLMARFPKVIERPIVISNDRAIIGRPPENVLKILT